MFARNPFDSRSARWRVFLTLLMCSGVSASEPAAARDATLSTTAGAKVKLSAHWGKPVIMFYENRSAASLNQHFRDALTKYAVEHHLMGAVQVLAVADLEGFDWFPARQIAISAVKDIAEKTGVTVLIDWSGTLRAPPWSLPADTSTVLLFDRSGRAVFQLSGAVTDAQREDVFARIHALIDAAPKQ